MQPDIAVKGIDWAVLDEPARAALRPLLDSGVLVTYRDDSSGAVRLTFAGESVAAGSERLREFIAANAELIAWRDRLHARASLWRLGGEAAELLLTEDETRTALRWKAERQAEFSTLELSFIDESLKSQHGFARPVPSRPAPVEDAPAVAVETPAVASPPQTAMAAAAAANPAPVARSTPPVPPPITVETTSSLQSSGSRLAPARSSFRWAVVLATLVTLAVATGWFLRRLDVAPLSAPATAEGTVDQRAREALRQSQYADAVRLFTEALNAGKPVLLERAYAYRLAGDLAAAIADYNKAIMAGAADDQAYSDAAYTATLMGKPEQAIGYLTKGLHRSPSNASLYVDRASAYLTLKEYRPALSDYERALQIDATSAAAQTGRVAALNHLNLPTGRADLLPRVYIHIGSEVQRDEARRIQGVLRDLGYQAPGVQFVVSKNLDQNELRYVYPDDRIQAERLAFELQKAGVRVIVQKVDGTEVRPKHFELWFAPPGDGPADKKAPQRYPKAL